MDYEHEIRSLAAETLVLQRLFVELCAGLILKEPALRPVIAATFDSVANTIEDIAIQHGKAAHPEHLVKALRIVEDLRSVALGNP